MIHWTCIISSLILYSNDKLLEALSSLIYAREKILYLQTCVGAENLNIAQARSSRACVRVCMVERKRRFGAFSKSDVRRPIERETRKNSFKSRRTDTMFPVDATNDVRGRAAGVCWSRWRRPVTGNFWRFAGARTRLFSLLYRLRQKITTNINLVEYERRSRAWTPGGGGGARGGGGQSRPRCV